MFPFTILNKEEIQKMEAFHRLLENRPIPRNLYGKVRVCNAVIY